MPSSIPATAQKLSGVQSHLATPEDRKNSRENARESSVIAALSLMQSERLTELLRVLNAKK